MNKISKHQKFVSETINRSQIKNAEYNPRKISEENEKELRKGLKKFGLVDALIWNKRTGNLVGGHQRIKQLDALEGSSEYMLTVSCIDVDEKSEKEINVLLNNPNLQGEYDEEALSKLVGEIDFKNAGFTDYDLDIMGIDVDLKKLDEEDQQETKSMEEKIAEIKNIKKGSKEKSRTLNENFLVLTFTTPEAKEDLLKFLGQEIDDRYIKGERIAELLSKKGKK